MRIVPLFHFRLSSPPLPPSRCKEHYSNARNNPVMFNPVTFHKAGPDQIAKFPEGFLDFLGAIFPEWWCKRDRYQGVDLFHSLADYLMKNGESLLCVD